MSKARPVKVRLITIIILTAVLITFLSQYAPARSRTELDGPYFCLGTEHTGCPPEYKKTMQIGYPVAFKTQVIHLTENPYRSDLQDETIVGHKTNYLHFFESVALWSILIVIVLGAYDRLAKTL